MPLKPGARLGEYEIAGLIGTGGMGEVYRARDPKLARSVAVKVLNVDARANAHAVRRFATEARAASALHHPGIVSIHDIGEHDGHCYIVMELVDGVTLRQFLRRGGPELKKALHIARQLAGALAEAHEAGVVHRDLKPENVMVTGDGQVKVVDFGLAKLTQPLEMSNSAETRSARGGLLGTVGYMSPEQAQGEEADFRADQFAFGAILYELVTGARAFHRPTAIDTLSMILHEAPHSALVVNPTLPEAVTWTIDRCLSKDPSGRYASTRDLMRDVQTLQEHLDELVAVTPPARPSNKRWAAVLAAAVLAGVGSAAYLMVPGPTAASAGGPTFTRLTFGHGHISSARFAPDGETVLYAAGWNGAPVQVFETRVGDPESRSLGIVDTSVAGVLPTELALISGCRLDWANCSGTLARVSRNGGVPRELAEDVVSADWDAAGQVLAAIQTNGGEYQLQWPVGTPRYTSDRKLGYLRFSPDGDRLAFVEHDLVSDESGFLKVIDRTGQAMTVPGWWQEIRELDWSPDGEEIWVSASERARSTDIYAVTLSGARRLLFAAPGGVYLQDVTRDGKALVTRGVARAHMVWTSGPERRELSWLDWSTVADMSSNGKTILFYEWGEAVGTNPVVYLRAIDNPDAVRLGEGRALALSPDGRWAVALQETPALHLVLLPTGPGAARPLPAEGLTDFYWARWFPDGRRLLIVGADAEGVPGSFVQHVDTGRLEPIAQKGVLALLVSPDGRRVLAYDPLEGHVVWPLDDELPVALTSIDPRHRAIQWSDDGRFLYVRESEEALVRIHRFDMATGRSELLQELEPGDPSGVVGVGDGHGELTMTPDGRSFVFTYWSFARDLYLVDHLSR